MTETTALGAAVAAGAAEGIAVWDIKTKNESSDVSIFQPKLDASGKNVVLKLFNCVFLYFTVRVVHSLVKRHRNGWCHESLREINTIVFFL